MIEVDDEAWDGVKLLTAEKETVKMTKLVAERIISDTLAQLERDSKVVVTGVSINNVPVQTLGGASGFTRYIKTVEIEGWEGEATWS